MCAGGVAALIQGRVGDPPVSSSRLDVRGMMGDGIIG